MSTIWKLPYNYMSHVKTYFSEHLPAQKYNKYDTFFWQIETKKWDNQMEYVSLYF